MSRLLSAAFFVVFAIQAHAQSLESLKGPDKSLYDNLRKGEGNPDSDEAKAVFVKQAKYLVARLSDPSTIQNQSNNIVTAMDALIVQKEPPKNDVKPADIAFSRAMGNALVAELKPALSHSKLDVRVNAARMLSIVALTGCDEIVEPALELLKDEGKAEAHVYGLQALKNIFAYTLEPGSPEKDAFRPNLRETKHKAIQFLCDYVLRKPNLQGKSTGEIAAIHYLRREAVQALGFVREHRLRYEGKTLAMPGWVLLKVANGDGIEPPPEMLERTLAIYAFTQLFSVRRANVDRDVDIAFAADRLGAPIIELLSARVNPPVGQATALASVPWKKTVVYWEYGLNIWQKNAAAMQLNGAPAANALYNRAKSDLLDPLIADAVNNVNANEFLKWFSSTRPTKGTTLYADEPTSTVKPCS